MFSEVASPSLSAVFASTSCWKVSIANQPALIVCVIFTSLKLSPVPP